MLTEVFWVNLIGKGYPAPSRRFRWCTERLKIEPANDFIKGRVAEFGEVVMVLGVRSSESATRAQVMSLHRIKNSALSRHASLLNAFVYGPIESFSTDDVWTYLLQTPSPWGNDNRDLVAMYRNAQGRVSRRRRQDDAELREFAVRVLGLHRCRTRSLDGKHD